MPTYFFRVVTKKVIQERGKNFAANKLMDARDSYSKSQAFVHRRTKAMDIHPLSFYTYILHFDNPCQEKSDKDGRRKLENIPTNLI